MMINEFVDLTGFKPTDDYYHTEIEPIYERSDMDKRDWCKQWKKNGGIQKAYDALREQAANDYTNVLSLENEVKNLKEQLSRLKDMNDSQSQIIRDEREKLFNANQANEKLNNERKDLIEFLINSAEEWGASDIRERVISMIGSKEYIRYKIEHDLRLWDLDKKLIMTLIKFNQDLESFRKETEEDAATLYEDANTSFTLKDIKVENGCLVYEYDGMTESERIVYQDADSGEYYEDDIDGISEWIKFWRKCLRRAKRYWSMDPDRLDKIQDGEIEDQDDEEE